MSLGGYNHELHIPGEKPHIVDYNGSNNMYSIKMFGAKVNNYKENFKIINYFFYQVGSKNLTYYSYDFQNPMIDSGTTLMFASSSLILYFYELILLNIIYYFFKKIIILFVRKLYEEIQNQCKEEGKC